MAENPQRIYLVGLWCVLAASGCRHEIDVDPVWHDPSDGGFSLPTHAPRRGSDSARVTMVEFADFQCPYCGTVEPTVETVMAAYPVDVGLVFVNLPLAQHAHALPAAEAFLAAARQGQAWEMHDQMFAHQSALTDGDLDGYASAIGLDLAQFDADRASPEIADEVAQDRAFAISLGVNATPSFYIGGYWLVGAQPYSEFQKRIDKVLATAQADAAVGGP